MFRSSHPAKGDPQLDYMRLRIESPVSKISYLDESPDAWLVVRHKDVCTVLTDERLYKVRRVRSSPAPIAVAGSRTDRLRLPIQVPLKPGCPGFPEMSAAGKMAAARSGSPFGMLR